MKLLINVKLIFTTFLLVLYLNDAHGAPTDEAKNKEKNNPSGSTAASDSQNEENIIKTTLTDSSELTGENKSFSFSIQGNNQLSLKYPAKIARMKFNSKTLVFSDKTKLPNNIASFVVLYTCNHGNPILINIKSHNQNYFYSLKSAKKGWVNHTLDSSKDFAETDPNEVTYYEYDPNDKADKGAQKFYGQLNKSLTKLSKKSCKKKCSDNTAENSILEITLKPEQQETS